MNHARNVLVLEACLALARFLITPTWPCAVVALGTLVLVTLALRSTSAEVMAVVEEVERVKSVVADGLRDVNGALRVDIQRIESRVADAQARAERLEANRALGG